VATQSGVPGSPLVLHCILVHAHLEALPQAAGSALVPVGLVHHTETLLLGLAHVLPGSPNAPLEESGTAITGIDAVVLAGTVISADFAGHMV